MSYHGDKNHFIGTGQSAEQAHHSAMIKQAEEARKSRQGVTINMGSDLDGIPVVQGDWRKTSAFEQSVTRVLGVLVLAMISAFIFHAWYIRQRQADTAAYRMHHDVSFEGEIIGLPVSAKEQVKKEIASWLWLIANKENGPVKASDMRATLLNSGRWDVSLLETGPKSTEKLVFEFAVGAKSDASQKFVLVNHWRRDRRK